MNKAELSPESSCVSAFLRPRLKENRSPVSGRVPVRQHLTDPPPVAMPPVVGQPLLVTGPFREVRVLDEQLRLPETAIPPTVPVSWVLPPVAKLLGPLLLAHLSSPSHSFLCKGQYVCYSSRRSPSLKKLDSSTPLRPLRYQAPGTRRIHQMGYYWISPACSELPRTPFWRSSRNPPAKTLGE